MNLQSILAILILLAMIFGVPYLYYVIIKSRHISHLNKYASEILLILGLLYWFIYLIDRYISNQDIFSDIVYSLIACLLAIIYLLRKALLAFIGIDYNKARSAFTSFELPSSIRNAIKKTATIVIIIILILALIIFLIYLYSSYKQPSIHDQYNFIIILLVLILISKDR